MNNQRRKQLAGAIEKLEQAVALIEETNETKIFVSCTSFGFKYGSMSEADLIFDVRCFPNPFYVPELKHHTGLDCDVREFVFSSEETKTFLKKLCEMVEFLLPLYIREGKRYLTVAIGCTGGKHRSVAISEALCEYIQAKGYKAVGFHRDIDKE